MVPLTEQSPKHQAILGAAAEVFSEHGFAKARIEDIANKAEVGKGTVYEYFQSKEHLLLRCCINVCAKNEEKILSAQGQLDADNINYAEAMRSLMRTVIVTVVGSDIKEIRLFFQLWNAADKAPELAAEAKNAIQELYRKWEGIIRELFQAGIDKGVFKDWPDKDMLGHLLTAVVDGWIWQRNFRDVIEAESMADRFVNSVMPLILKEQP